MRRAEASGSQAPRPVASLPCGLAVELIPEAPTYVTESERLVGQRLDSDFWEHRLPEQMRELAEALPWQGKFDAIIVDEGQDFADSWWLPLLAALRRGGRPTARLQRRAAAGVPAVRAPAGEPDWNAAQ